MAFTVYPDAATAALLGSPANQPVDTTKMTLLVPTASFGGNPFGTTLFIRISVSLPTLGVMVLPTVTLRARNVGAGTQGAPVIITSTLSPGQGLADGTNGTPAAAAWFEGAPANNVYLLKVFIEIDGTGIDIQINSVGHNFVWVVADNDTDSQQPWIQLTPFPAFGALINQPATINTQALQINNRGTGSLTVTTISPALAAPYSLNPAGTLNSGLPATVLPNQATPTNVLIGFTTAAVGVTAPTSYTVDGDNGAVSPPPSGHNKGFSLSATATQLEVVLALDTSGSMAATDTTSASSRLSELQTAASQFVVYLKQFGQTGGNFGVVQFPGSDPNNFTTFSVVPWKAIPAPPMGPDPDIALINGLMPTDATPMDGAILEATSGAFFSGTTTNLRWMLLMSDGAWNVGNDPNNEGVVLKGKNIIVFSAGYGQSGQVDYATLSNLATKTNGQALQVDIGAGISAVKLAQKFKSVIAAGLTINAATDPDGIIFPGQDVRHEIIITPYDRKAVFSLNWDTPNIGLTLQLLTPTCELITPQSAANTPGITFHTDARYQMYGIDESYLHNNADPSQPRHGTWRMIVSYPNVILELRAARAVAVGPVGEHYSYDVLTDSALKLDVTLDRDVYYAGDPITVAAKLTVQGLPVTGASARLSVTAPGQSMDNWLAGIPITAAEYQNAAALLAGKDAFGVYIKAFAAQLKGLVFDGLNSTTGLAMTDSNNSGVYSATVDQTSVPDSHKLYVTVTGTTADGVTFRRERSVEVHVGVRPDPRFTRFSISYGAQANPAMVTGLVTLTPLDSFGNVVLVDPASSHYIQLQAQGATLDPKLATTFNGTYTSGVTYPVGSSPVFSLVVGGQPVFTGKPIVPIGQFIWVDQVVKFTPGLEGAPGANKHTNPDDALGDILATPNTFTSLGGYGSLAVRIRGQLITASGGDEVTVFVQPDDSPRAYLVEALSANRGDDKDKDKDDDDDDDDKTAQWVALGTSPGTTASFSLSAGKLSAAKAICITDQSGLTGTRSNPYPTPGVSVNAVGIKSASAGSTGSDSDICIRLRVLNPQRQPLGGTVDIEFQPQDAGRTSKVSGVDASKDIDVKGLQRFPQVHVYQVTVTPTDVFKPTSQFLTIPASGFHTVEFVIDKSK